MLPLNQVALTAKNIDSLSVPREKLGLYCIMAKILLTTAFLCFVSLATCAMLVAGDDEHNTQQEVDHDENQYEALEQVEHVDVEPIRPETVLPAGLTEPLEILKQVFAAEYQAHPHLYDSHDVEEFFNDGSGKATALQFLVQRNLEWKNAYYLTAKTLKWRHKIGVRQLAPHDFPCDLFRLGLIFEEGTAYKHGHNGEVDPGNPVIWIRLGALGSVIKHLEGIKPTRAVSYVYNTVRSGVKKVRNLARHVRRSRKRTKSSRKARKSRRAARSKLIHDMSPKNDGTIKKVLNGITWWLDDWRHRHPQGAQATLVLDFENTDFALSSWSMGEFFIGLDDHFPNLFDTIIGFRFKPKLWSLRAPISMFNRIFKSRISSSLETDRKLKFVKKEPQIDSYMARVDQAGVSLLPQHVSGDCAEPKHPHPDGCQEDPNALGGEPRGFDPQLWQAIHHEFYAICRPLARPH